MSSIICHKCKKPIRSLKDLRVIMEGHIKLLPFHSGCIKYPVIRILASFYRPKILNTPINSKTLTYLSIFLAAIGSMVLALFIRALTAENSLNLDMSPLTYFYFALISLVILILFYPLFIRIHSYLKFERHLKK
ncbi:MAG: hypothetical protein KAT77_00865 [Nanoarchaeota archaeon]|nr:hypothetical protein [Nanoarchaeota archaeon]